MGNKDGSNIDPELVKTVVMAIKQGYHHLDGAEGKSPPQNSILPPHLSNSEFKPEITSPQVYGNEAELGQAIIDSGVPREKLFITTKINGTKQQNTLESFNTSLAKLKLDYVDLYLIHAPYFATTPLDLQNKWSEMESILASGKAKSIGVSNFLQPHLETILQTAKVIPAINQIEYHPYLQHGNLVDFHRKHGIVTEAYSPLAAVTKGAPGPLDVVYERLAGKYGVSVGEVALRWTVDRGVVALTTSGKEERLRDYLRICDFRLTDEEVEEIMEVGGRKHFRVFWRGKFGDDDRS